MSNLNNANLFFQKKHYPQTPLSKAPILILDNLRSPENIGHILRLSGNIGCKKVLVINNEVKPAIAKIKRVAKVAGEIPEWQFCNPEEIFQLLPSDYILTALETAPQSISLSTVHLPEKMALILGNESYGINNELLQRATLRIHIPITGKIKSYNVSHATALCLFEWIKQHVIQV